MAVRAVLRMGHPVLLQKAKPVENLNDPRLMMLLEDMFDTMAHLDGAGLAAPQIGESLRVVIFGITHNPRYPDVEEVPLTVLINPVITPLTTEKEEGWEGCLSVPGLRGRVPRFTSVRYQGLDQNGNVIDRTVNGFHARVVQHECDHLDGILYPTRIKDFSSFGFIEELGIQSVDD